MLPELDKALRSVGPRITAVCLNMQDARGLMSPLDTDALDRLECLNKVIDTLRGTGYGDAVVAAFMRAASDFLDGDAIIMRIRRGDYKSAEYAAWAVAHSDAMG